MTSKHHRYYLKDLDRHDLEHDDCVVRQLEMEVDAAITSPGYAVQFWRDVRLYGMDEAILYVRNGNHGNADAIQAEWQNVRHRINRVVK